MIKKDRQICFRCKKEILMKEDTYFAFSEYDKNKLIRTDYTHKICWNEFLRKIGDTTEAMGLIRGLKGFLVNKGILSQHGEAIK